MSYDDMSCVDPAREEMEAEYGAFSSEFEAALALSHREAGDDRGAIRQAVAAGRFVVVASAPRFCRLTDALMGEDLSLVSEHGTRAEADAALPESSEDVSYEVRGPVVARLEAIVDQDGEDDLPF